jgi:hypothetical protein
MPSIGLIAAGFVLGLFLLPVAIRWAVLVHTVFALHGGDFLGIPKRRLQWAAPLAVFFHPVPYLIIGPLPLSNSLLPAERPRGGFGF